MRGNAVTTDHQGGSGRYSVAFDRDVSGCVATATWTDAQNGPTLETPPAGRISLGIDGSRVLVRTFAADGNVQDLRVRRARGLLAVRRRTRRPFMAVAALHRRSGATRRPEAAAWSGFRSGLWFRLRPSPRTGRPSRLPPLRGSDRSSDSDRASAAAPFRGDTGMSPMRRSSPGPPLRASLPCPPASKSPPGPAGQHVGAEAADDVVSGPAGSRRRRPAPGRGSRRLAHLSTMSLPGPARTSSSPAPAITTSARPAAWGSPKKPRSSAATRSLPSPARMRSSPSPPQIRSFPPKATITSSPPCATITSSPGVPSRSSEARCRRSRPASIRGYRRS